MGVMHKNTTGAGLGNPATNAETVIYTTPVMSTGPGATAIGISGTVNITPGTGATAIVIRVRQGSIAGPVVSNAAPSHTVVAGAPQNISFGCTDMSTFTEGQNAQYVITAQQTGGTANGTTNLVDVEVLV